MLRQLAGDRLVFTAAVLAAGAKEPLAGRSYSILGITDAGVDVATSISCWYSPGGIVATGGEYFNAHLLVRELAPMLANTYDSDWLLCACTYVVLRLSVGEDCF